ncbi:MAG: hypothetical protein ICV79_25225, partial [Flavisolibacter sp.]|nr:hypothetical protein [Flavisolibacter sp.]
EITIIADRKTLETKAQKELKGNVGIIALPAFDYTILRDTATEIYLHFTNFSLRITKEGKEIFTRKNEEVIWAEQIINFELSKDDNGEPVFRQFLNNISGDKNLSCFRSACGYLLRNYNGSEGTRAIWLCDESYETGKQNGRTGKSLLWKAIARSGKQMKCRAKNLHRMITSNFKI